MKPYFFLSLALILCVRSHGQSSQLTEPIDFTKINSFIIFGDSLSDDGNTGTVFNTAFEEFSSFLSSYIAIPGWGTVPGYSSGSAGDFTKDFRFTNNNMWWYYFARKVYEEINPGFALNTERSLPITPYQLEFQAKLWPGSIKSSVEANTNQNWAWGGAKVNLDNELSIPPVAYNPISPEDNFFGGTVTLNSVATQISHAINSKDSAIADDDVAIFLWAGANDYILYSASGKNLDETAWSELEAGLANVLYNMQEETYLPPNIAQNAAAGQVNNAKTLIASGAQTIIVMGLPDIGKTPAANSGSAPNGIFGDLSITPTQYIKAFNSALIEGLETLQANNPDVTIRYFDVESALNDIIEKTIENDGYAGLKKEYLSPKPISAWVNDLGAFNSKVTDADVENEFAGWLFWDHVHPTQAGHKLLGEALFAAIVSPTSTDIPTPQNALLSSGKINPNGLQNSWMGQVDITHWPLFWHEHLGWSYYHSGDASGLWAYDYSEDMWWHSNTSTWPLLYSATILDWLIAQSGFGSSGAGDLVKLSDYNAVKRTQAPDVD